MITIRSCKGVLVGTVLLAMIGTLARADDVLYSDGAVNGTYNAWPINAGVQVEDSFTVSSSTITGVSFGNWITTGDTASTIEWSIVGSEGSQTPVCAECSGIASVSGVLLTSSPAFGDIYDESFSLPDITLGAGTYWLELQDEVVSNDGAGAWDMNGGPSDVWDSDFGDVSGPNCTAAGVTLGTTLAPGTCSNSFEIFGSPSTTVSEPDSLVLFAMTLLGLGVARVRRRSDG